MAENTQDDGGTGGRRLLLQFLRSSRALTSSRTFPRSRRSGRIRAIVPSCFERRKNQ